MEQVRLDDDLEVVVTPEPVVTPAPPSGPEVNAAVVALLERSREGLRTSAAELDARQAARTARDFTTADAIRDRLAAAGIAIEDTPSGARWSLARRNED